MSVNNAIRPKKNLKNCKYCGLNVWNLRRAKRTGCCTRNCFMSLKILNGEIDHHLADELRTKYKRYGGSMYTTIRWLNLRHLVIYRDGFMCRKCKSRDNLHVDHITPVSWNRGGYWRMNNLQVLCGPCNMAKSNKENIRYSLSVPSLPV
jgi:hypothetical protein